MHPAGRNPFGRAIPAPGFIQKKAGGALAGWDLIFAPVISGIYKAGQDVLAAKERGVPTSGLSR